MGLDQTVTFPAGTAPSWTAVRDALARQGLALRLQMIDGQLAFPDEMPADDWRELRCGTSAGMVTVRRAADRLSLIVWGNADAALLQVRAALAAAFAQVTGGVALQPGAAEST